MAYLGGPSTSVAGLSVNLYDAAKSANLPKQDLDVINQVAAAFAKGKELRQMSPTDARNHFKALTPEAQDQLRGLFPTEKWAAKDPSVARRIFGVVTFPTKIIASPLMDAWKGVQVLNRTLNTAPSVVEQATVNKKSVFSTKIWSDAYKGINQWDDKRIAALEEKYGKADVAVAKANAEGLPPSAILDRWGKVDGEILGAIQKSLDDPESYKKVRSEVAWAKLNPGDLLFRSSMDTHAPTTSGSLLDRFATKVMSQKWLVGDMEDPKIQKAWEELTDRELHIFSAGANTIFQLGIDPTTYITGGTGELLTKGEKLTASTLARINAGMTPEDSVAKLFTDPKVSNLWDNEMGPLLDKFAKGDRNVKADVFREIRTLNPAYNNLEDVKILADGGVKDAATAQDYFSKIDNTSKLFSGSVNGIDFYRNGVATARTGRQIAAGRAAYLDSMFNATIGERGFYKTVDEAATKAEGYINALKTAGEEIDKGVNPNLPSVAELEADMTKAQKLGFNIGLLLERNPGGGQILFGDDAVKTAENVRLITRLGGFDRTMSDFIMMGYLESSADEQVVMLRNLYYMIFQRYGIPGTPHGDELIERILNKTFNEKYGFAGTVRTELNKDIAGVTSKHSVNWENDVPILKTRGGIQPSQITEGIAPPPMEEILNISAMNKVAALGKEGGWAKASWRAPLQITDGMTRHWFVRNLTDVWSFFTIASRLGIRSAIDEIFMYMMTAPSRDLVNFAKGGGRAAGNVATAFTGSKGAVGPIERVINKVFRKGGPEEAISGIERRSIVVELQKELSEKAGYEVPIEAVRHMQIREETSRRAFGLYGNDMDPQDVQHLKDLLIHNPNFANAMASSVGARTSMSGQIEKEFIDSMFPVSSLTSALNELAVKSGKTYRPVEARAGKRIAEKYIALAHFDNFWIRFVHNTRNLGDGFYINPVKAFFNNRGLKTPRDFERARNELMHDVGLTYDVWTDSKGFEDGAWKVANNGAAALAKFNSMFGNSVLERQGGRTEVEIAQTHIETMLHDMRNTFHGGPESFNQGLLDKIQENHDALVKLEKDTEKDIPRKWEKAAASLEFPEFENLTSGKHPESRNINTRLELPDMQIDNVEGWFRAKGNYWMEVADRQVNALYRQPAGLITYFRVRKEYKGLEKRFLDEQYSRILDSYEHVTPQVEAKVLKQAKDLASKRYAEIASDISIHTILKYADNPAVRSNLALSIRAVGRYFRSTEDFYRRLYRMAKERPLQVIYRMRLMQLGMNGSGVWHKDQNGNDYLIIPTDSIINHAVQPTLNKVLGVNDQYQVPQFNEFTLKLSLLNPSFSQDAGAPTLSSPVASLMMLGIKALAGHSPFFRPEAEKLSNTIDGIALGPMGNQLTLARAIIPLQLQNIWAALPYSEQSRQEATAQMQATAWMIAHGRGLPSNPTLKQINDFKKAIRVGAHNIIVLRSLTGVISPFMPTMQEGKDLPGYYKDAGLPSLRSSYYDIKAGIDANLGTDTSDPWELALGTFMGKDPKKIVYTISRSDKQTKIILDKTTAMKNWVIDNRGFIKNYGEAAYLFSPHSNDYNAAIYTWLEGQDLMKIPSFETYLDRAQVAEDKAAYFDIARKEDEALANTNSISERQKIIADATYARKQLLASNPLLRDNKVGVVGTSSIGEEEKMLKSMKEMLADPQTPIDRDHRVLMKTLVAQIDEYRTFASNPDNGYMANFSDVKRQMKDTINQLFEPLLKDPVVREANRTVFQGILNYYSRDTYAAFRR